MILHKTDNQTTTSEMKRNLPPSTKNKLWVEHLTMAYNIILSL